MSATMGINMTLTNMAHITAEARNTTVQVVDRRRAAAVGDATRVQSSDLYAAASLLQPSECDTTGKIFCKGISDRCSTICHHNTKDYH